MQQAPLSQDDTESHTAGSGRWVYAVQATSGTPNPPELPRSLSQECHRLFLQENEGTKRFVTDIFEHTNKVKSNLFI